ncbi:MAG TPA: penicillin-binding transpeptidase domain-containing protein [Armatimonadota bacterium]|nr:penicillin-binding transpeptidase domain-containing protein [Armatimonadota bacterium]
MHRDVAALARLRMGPAGLIAALAVPLLAAASYAANTGRPAIDELSWVAPFVAVAAVGAVWLAYWVRGVDLALYAVAACLLGLSLVEMHRLKPELAGDHRALAITCLALAVGVASWLRRSERLESYTYLCGIGAAMLLAAALVFGVEVNGVRQWLRIGPLTFQPSELSKVFMCVFLAGYLDQRREVLANWTERFAGIPYPSMRHLGPLLVMWAASVLLIVCQRDLGCALVFFCVFLSVLHVATSRPVFVGLGLSLFAAAAYVCYPRFSHLAIRVTAWLNPWPYIDDQPGYQIIQSLFALASGGPLGTGIGRGLPDRVPVVESDFIFSAFAEELGYVGAAALCLAFALLACRILAHARNARSDFACLLGSGLAAGFGLQAAIIIAGVTKAIPMTGITLPFLSHGGSSLLASGLALGLVLKLSQECNLAMEQRCVAETPWPGARPWPLARLHVFLFATLTLRVGYWQIVRGPELSVHPRNPRLLAVERSIERGKIVDRNGVVLAGPGQNPGERVYPQGRLFSHVVGYRDERYGLAGVEAEASGCLLGLTERQGSILDVIQRGDRRARGYDVRLTLDAALQRRAWDRLGNRRGAVVALDPATGEILALAAKPSFDPAQVAKILSEGGEREGLMLNRATQGLYPPGSAFKILLAAAALDSGKITEGFEATCTGVEVIEHDRIVCSSKQGHGRITMERALAGSCNIYFAHVGLELGPGLFTQYARAFGIGEALDIGVNAAVSRLAAGGDLATTALLLESSFGQGQLQITPLQMAMIAGTIANRGVLMHPHVIGSVSDGDEVIHRSAAQPMRQVVAPEVAGRVAEMMHAVTTSGSGRGGAVPGVPTAGKTGTAENPHGRPHAWFVGFAPVRAPRIAVAVVVENGGSGGSVAAPIARDVMRAWLQRN